MMEGTGVWGSGIGNEKEELIVEGKKKKKNGEVRTRKGFTTATRDDASFAAGTKV